MPRVVGRPLTRTAVGVSRAGAGHLTPGAAPLGVRHVRRGPARVADVALGANFLQPDARVRGEGSRQVPRGVQVRARASDPKVAVRETSLGRFDAREPALESVHRAQNHRVVSRRGARGSHLPLERRRDEPVRPPVVRPAPSAVAGHPLRVRPRRAREPLRGRPNLGRQSPHRRERRRPPRRGGSPLRRRPRVLRRRLRQPPPSRGGGVRGQISRDGRHARAHTSGRRARRRRERRRRARRDRQAPKTSARARRRHRSVPRRRKDGRGGGRRGPSRRWRHSRRSRGDFASRRRRKRRTRGRVASRARGDSSRVRSPRVIRAFAPSRRVERRGGEGFGVLPVRRRIPVRRVARRAARRVLPTRLATELAGGVLVTRAFRTIGSFRAVPSNDAKGHGGGSVSPRVIAALGRRPARVLGRGPRRRAGRRERGWCRGWRCWWCRGCRGRLGCRGWRGRGRWHPWRPRPRHPRRPRPRRPRAVRSRRGVRGGARRRRWRRRRRRSRATATATENTRPLHRWSANARRRRLAVCARRIDTCVANSASRNGS